MSPVNQLDLFDQLSYYEGADVEYKSAAGGLPRSLWETYSAFANTGGGSIWLGVVQKDGHLDVHGIENAQKLIGDLWNLVNNREKVSRNLLSENDVQIISTPIAGKSLIFIRVPRASRRDRPLHVGLDPFRGTYRRHHEGDYLCSADEVRRMIADQMDEPADSRILTGFGWDDLHPESMRQFRNRMASVRPGHAWLSEDDPQLLTRLGGWRRDRKSAQEGVTVAGLLMFGRELAIRDPAGVPGFHLDYRERYSDDPAVRWTDRLTLDGTWEGNLFQFYQQVTMRLGAGPGIKTPFQVDAEGYRRTTTSVHEALQEALVNALIHADHAGQGGIVIDRYLDRFEFSNPGTLLLSREQLLTGGVSECRNKSLQQMFQMLGAGDKAGSGIDKIRMSWAAEHWQSPRLIETVRPDRVQLVLPMVSTLPDDVMKRLVQRFGAAFQARTADEIHALVAAEVEGGITNQRLQEMLVLHRVDITRMLRGLVKDGFLTSDGQGRGTRYFPMRGNTQNRLDQPEPSQEASSPNSEASSPNSEASSPNSQASSPNSSGMGGDKAMPVLDPDLLDIARIVSEAGTAPRARVREAILMLCRDRYLTIQQLATLLKRKPDTLRGQYLASLLREGDLVLRYPQAPNHPGQAYCTAHVEPRGAPE